MIDDVCSDYLHTVRRCMIEQLHLDESKVTQHFCDDAQYIEDLFAEDREIVLHDDPVRLATSLGVRWGLMERPKWIIGPTDWGVS